MSSSGILETSFKEAMRQVAATVSIISTELGGSRYGMTATAVTSVSLDPPSLLVCVNRSASIHAPLQQRGLFWVNVLHDGQQSFCATFSGGKARQERFALGRWQNCEHGLPYLADAQANILCSVEKDCTFGSHTVFIGSVLATRLHHRATPLVYLNGRFAAVLEGLNDGSGSLVT
jgi:flavin reductase